MDIFAEQFYRSLADTTRLRLLTLMEKEGELCVCELTRALGLSQPKISRHLAQLRETKVVRDRRQGLWVYYQLEPDLPAWAHEVLHTTARALASTEPFVTDRKTLRQTLSGQPPDAARCEKNNRRAR